MFLFISISFCLLLTSIIPTRRQKPFLFLSFILLFILFAFRDISVGTDTINYEERFYRYQDIEWLRDLLDPGWVLISDLTLFLGFDYRGLMVISALLCMLPIYYVANKHSKNPMLTITLYVVLYFYLQSFNITRQYIAVGIVFLSVSFLLSGKRKSFIAGIIIACTFHKSAIIASLFYFYKKLPDKLYSQIILIIFSLIIGIFGFPLLQKVISILGYGRYIYLYGYEFGNVLGNLSSAVIFNLFFIALLIKGHKFNDYSKILFLYVLIFNLCLRMPFGGRIELYFSIMQILIYPYVLFTVLKSNKNSNFEKSFYLFMILLFCYANFLMKLGDGEIFPYNNILF